MPNGVEMIVVIGQAGDMHQTVNGAMVEFYEQAKRRHTRDHASKAHADVLRQIETLKALMHIPLRFLSPA